MNDVSKITDSRNDDAKALLKLATARFGKLTPAEEKLFRCTALGEPADYSSVNADKNDPAEAKKWGDDRVLRAEIIEWLCADKRARDRITRQGLRVGGARIEGVMNFESLHFPYRCSFVECSIAEGAILLDSLFLTLSLTGSHTGALLADRMIVEGSLFLNDGFKAEGGVRLLGAKIGGVLECSGGAFLHPYGYALGADGMKVEGCIFLRDRFKAVGEVRLPSAVIGGNLECDGGIFTNSGGNALLADQIEVKGSVFLRGGLVADGILNFSTATVKGEFQLHGISAESEFQLDLEGAQIGILWDKESSWPKTKGDLRLHGLVYENLAKDAPWDVETRIKWLELQDDKEYFPQPYEQLAMVLKKNGHVVDARNVLIAKEKFRKAKGKLSWSERWLWYKTLGPMIGYGYRPLWALVPAILIIALGAGLFWDGQELIAPTGGKPTAAESGEDGFLYPSFNAIVYSLDTFVPIVDFHQVKYRLPNAEMVANPDKKVWQVRSGSLLLAWFWIEVGAGWVISSLLVVGLTRFVRS